MTAAVDTEMFRRKQQSGYEYYFHNRKIRSEQINLNYRTTKIASKSQGVLDVPPFDLWTKEIVLKKDVLSSKSNVGLNTNVLASIAVCQTDDGFVSLVPLNYFESKKGH